MNATDICPQCDRELWTHTRDELAECRAKLGGFAIVCGPGGRGRMIPLADLEGA